MVSNPNQDVTLDEMAEIVTKWMCDNFGWEWEVEGRAKIEGLKMSLDVIREVEEVLCKEYRWGYCVNLCLQILGDGFEKFVNPNLNWGQLEKLVLADSETRLRAIYRTLIEANEIS